MIFISIIIGCIIGALIGINAPVIPYTYSTFLAIAVVAALDSVFGGITSVLKKNFNLVIFISGFFCNSLLSIVLTYLGQKLFAVCVCIYDTLCTTLFAKPSKRTFVL